MTNRDKLIKTNIYDLLCEINDELAEFEICIMECLPGAFPNCPFAECKSRSNCWKCIQNWLDEEEKE